MSNGNGLTIRGGSVHVIYTRSHFKNNGDEDIHQEDVVLDTLKINNEPARTLSEKDHIVVTWKKRGTSS